MDKKLIEQYITAWYSEQIPTKDWLDLLRRHKDLREAYNDKKRIVG